MAVANYINDLLYRYECVILPGFGAFITQQNPARIDRSSNEFYPPVKTVSFNRQLLNNDGLLANHIVEAEGIEYREALNRIDAFVEELHYVLKENGLVKLENIGRFLVNESEKVEFEPAAKTNFLKESFGLSSIQTAPVIRRSMFEKKNLEHKTSSRRVAKTEKTGINWFKYAAVGAMVVGLTGAAGASLYQSRIENHNLAEQQKAFSQLESQIQQATFIIDNPLPAITLSVSKQSGNYHIVAGAFRLEENADSKVDELKAEGFKARKIPANEFGLHQVLYSSHETRKNALQALAEVKKDFNPGAWLLVEDLQ